jgi:hypothetical protein
MAEARPTQSDSAAGAIDHGDALGGELSIKRRDLFRDRVLSH